MLGFFIHKGNQVKHEKFFRQRTKLLTEMEIKSEVEHKYITQR